ncbi:MAG: hypothetical protein IKJ55_04555, partial [Clostridia bacterium]|nr:hypothetical protein [Clostridia bacterium]
MKICKQLLSVLLVMALTLGIFGTFAVSAEGTPSVSLDVNEVVVDEEAGVYKLVFKMTATDVSVLGASIVFSYDTSMIQPVRKDTLADVNVTVSSTDTALKRVFSAFANDDYEFEFAPFAKAERENRMGLKVDTYSTDAYTPDGEMVFTEFYYRIKDGATPNKDAIRLETDFSDGSILKEMYPNPDEAAAVAINTGTTTGFFKYGAVNTGNNTALPLKSFTHSGTVVTSIRTVPNTLMQMEEDSVSTVVGSVGGSGDYFSLVMPDAVAEKLGINPQDVYGGVVTAGTPYDGLYMSGHIYVKDAAWVYTVADELTNLQKQSNIALKNGPTDVTFENVRISRMRRSSGGSLVIEAKRSEFADGVTSAKKYAGTVNLDSLTETTKITKEEVAMDPATIDKATFLAIADPYWANNLVITKGEEYIDTMDLDVEPFTADTLFLSMDRSHVYADAMKANTWTTASLGGWNVWYRAADSSGAIQGDQTGPYQVVVPKVSGEYKVYALKYGHGTSAKKAKVDVNGNLLAYFRKATVIELNGALQVDALPALGNQRTEKPVASAIG